MKHTATYPITEIQRIKVTRKKDRRAIEFDVADLAEVKFFDGIDNGNLAYYVRDLQNALLKIQESGEVEITVDVVFEGENQ